MSTQDGSNLPTLAPGDVALYAHQGTRKLWAVRVTRTARTLAGSLAIEAEHFRPGYNYPVRGDRRQFLSLDFLSTPGAAEPPLPPVAGDPG